MCFFLTSVLKTILKLKSKTNSIKYNCFSARLETRLSHLFVYIGQPNLIWCKTIMFGLHCDEWILASTAS